MESRKLLPPPDTKCLVCSKPCVIEAVKFTRCLGYIHAGCSGLPTYHLIHWFNSRIHHTCEQCIPDQHKKLNYDQEYAWVDNLLQQDTASKNKISCITPGPSNENGDEHFEESDVGQTSIMEPLDTILSPSSEDNNEKLSREDHQKANKDDKILKHDKICKFYTEHRCRFGKEGKDCKFKHPRICKAYQKYGRNPGKGCSTFKKCGLYHPKICEGSGTQCIDPQCMNLHLKGTRRHALKEKPSLNLNIETVDPHTKKKDEIQPISAQETHRCNTQTSDTTPIPSHFLGMQRSIQELQDQMANLLRIFRAQVPTQTQAIWTPMMPTPTQWQPKQVQMSQHPTLQQWPQPVANPQSILNPTVPHYRVN
ncbi:hypothetical protein Pcinc_019423 [Petrolisthes cinctipes]|uniref:C3H1-type domain-containing protein n=1 Tax=Petrolisthes cinctipes TaxID=88211 RepID=A0AAE1KL76_PETCI|nr:hypothetical protein Pcinc_019423 [Petrolisthes cinctipes]